MEDLLIAIHEMQDAAYPDGYTCHEPQDSEHLQSLLRRFVRDLPRYGRALESHMEQRETKTPAANQRRAG